MGPKYSYLYRTVVGLWRWMVREVLLYSKLLRQLNWIHVLALKKCIVSSTLLIYMHINSQQLYQNRAM